MTDIDLSTNLPEVPEGQFWSVSFGTSSVSRGSFYGDVSAVKVPDVTVWLYEKKTVGKRWKREIVSIVKKVTTPLVLNRMKGFRGFFSYGKVFDKVGDYSVLREDAYPELISAMASHILEEIKVEEANKARVKALEDAREALSGNYPPKKLPLV
jgi:hypothetical protein